ncbi:MAG: glutamine--fructose-6-phosphate transaminase (isomerizing) [Candidatus Yanofskybacteria bacterium]|nr:glutamine--fructose-6-phosphate transaminase (isomerizing) [Candidatus Yanofskybacteria bacterium]
MCGIFGFVSKEKINATPVIIDGLKRLEYRGYDSAGLALMTGRGIFCRKKAGRIFELEKVVGNNIESNIGIGQSRWATHGKPSDKNAHPHFSCDKKIYLVHNGIIENFKELRVKLEKRGHVFRSDTDTEVAAHLIEDFSKSYSFEEAVRLALKSIVGTYAFVIVNADNPTTMIVARNSSPLLVGLSDTHKFVASDASAILPHTRKVVYLHDGEFAILTPSDFRIATLDRKAVSRDQELIEWSQDEVKKNKFPHFMLKEIYEEPDAVENAIRGRLIVKDGLAKLGGLELVEDKIKRLNRVIISACGTAYLAGLTGEYMLEEYGEIPVEVEYASELRYKKQKFDARTALLSISQSGETADTLGALKEAKRKGALNLGLVNVVGSSIAREVDAGVYNHAGPEIGVASTKAFVSQLAVLSLLALFIGRQRDMSLVIGRRIASELSVLPDKMKRVLKEAPNIKKIARKYHKYDHFLYLGRKYNYPVALEGALKLKEVSYIHAEGYGAGEMKHGPIAMIDKNFPSMVIIPSDSMREKVLSNIQEIKARDGKVVAIATEGNKEISKIADDVIYIPKTLEMLTPMLSVMPLHLFAYYVGVMRGYDVDHPRNLAKAVSVE